MGENDLMFANSLFSHQNNKFVFIFISQISYKQREFSSEPGTKVPTVAKHDTEGNRMFWFFKYTL